VMAIVRLDRERNFTLTEETIVRITEKYGTTAAAIEELKQVNLHAFITVVWALLADDDPELTFEDTARLLYAKQDIMQQVDDAIVVAFTEQMVS